MNVSASRWRQIEYEEKEPCGISCVYVVSHGVYSSSDRYIEQCSHFGICWWQAHTFPCCVCVCVFVCYPSATRNSISTRFILTEKSAPELKFGQQKNTLSLVKICSVWNLKCVDDGFVVIGGETKHAYINCAVMYNRTATNRWYNITNNYTHTWGHELRPMQVVIKTFQFSHDTIGWNCCFYWVVFICAEYF